MSGQGRPLRPQAAGSMVPASAEATQGRRRSALPRSARPHAPPPLPAAPQSARRSAGPRGALRMRAAPPQHSSHPTARPPPAAAPNKSRGKAVRMRGRAGAAAARFLLKGPRDARPLRPALLRPPARSQPQGDSRLRRPALQAGPREGAARPHAGLGHGGRVVRLPRAPGAAAAPAGQRRASSSLSPRGGGPSAVPSAGGLAAGQARPPPRWQPGGAGRVRGAAAVGREQQRGRFSACRCVHPRGTLRSPRPRYPLSSANRWGGRGAGGVGPGSPVPYRRLRGHRGSAGIAAPGPFYSVHLRCSFLGAAAQCRPKQTAASAEVFNPFYGCPRREHHVSQRKLSPCPAARPLSCAPRTREAASSER